MVGLAAREREREREKKNEKREGRSIKTGDQGDSTQEADPFSICCLGCLPPNEVVLSGRAGAPTVIQNNGS